MKIAIITAIALVCNCAYLNKATFGVTSEGRVHAIEPRIGRRVMVFEVDSASYPGVYMNILKQTGIHCLLKYRRMKAEKDSLWLKNRGL